MPRLLLAILLLALAPASLAQTRAHSPAGDASGETAARGGAMVVQPPTQVGLTSSDADCNNCSSGQQSGAEDINLAAPLSVTDLTLWGAYVPSNVPTTDDFTVLFHADNSGEPGAAFSTQASLTPACRIDTGLQVFDLDEYVYRIDFATPVELPAGITHIQVYNNTDGSSDRWMWETGTLDPEEGIQGLSVSTQAPGVNWSRSTVSSFAFALNAGTTYCDVASINVDVSVNTFTNDPMRGESVVFRGPVTNRGAAPVFVYVYAEAEIPGGATFKRNVGGKTLQPGESFKYKDFPNSKNYFQIPTNAPAGVYTIRVYAASDNAGTVIYDQDSFQFTLPPISGLIPDAVPAASSLEIAQPHAAPNPFRVQTEVRYSLAEDTEVDLRVYDVTGREVASLASGSQPAGTHAATLRAGDLPGGVYVWRLAIGGEVTTGRITLTR